MNTTIEKIVEVLKESDIVEYAFLKQSDMEYSLRMRESCQWCPNFNQRWSCPPNIGAIDENIKKCQSYEYALLLSGYARIKDETIEKSGEETYVLSRRKKNPLYMEIKEKIQEITGSSALALTTFCTVCKKCALPEPCRFPEKATCSVESHGIRMVHMMEKLKFTRYSDKNGYTCIALILFHSEKEPDCDFGKRIMLQEYPPFIEGQEYLDSLCRRGDIRYPVALSATRKAETPGCMPLNGADDSSLSVLSCNSDMTTAVLKEEICMSEVPVNLLLMDTEGKTVGYAFTEGLMSVDSITAFLRKREKTSGSRRVILPLELAMLYPPLKKALPHWELLLGPCRMSDLGAMLKEQSAETAK